MQDSVSKAIIAVSSEMTVGGGWLGGGDCERLEVDGKAWHHREQRDGIIGEKRSDEFRHAARKPTRAGVGKSGPQTLLSWLAGWTSLRCAF